MNCPWCNYEFRTQPIIIDGIYTCSNCNKKYVFRDKGYEIKILMYKERKKD